MKAALLGRCIALGAACIVGCNGGASDRPSSVGTSGAGAGGGTAGSAAGSAPIFDISPLTSQPDIHRLNRAEYANTIRDLTGVQFDPSSLLVDSSSLGFDNISSIQTTTPGHVEAYLAAAERIADAIIDQAPTDVKLRYEADSTDVGKFGGQDHRDLIKDLGDGFWQLGGSDELRVTLRLPRDATYHLTVHARQAPVEDRIGNQIEPQGDPFVDFSVDAKLAGSVQIVQQIPVAANKPGVAMDYVIDVPLTRGVHSFAVGAHVGNCTSKVLNCGALVHVNGFAIENLGASNPDPNSAYNRLFTCKPSPGQEAQCAEGILRTFATRAWRRPVAPDTLGRLVSLVSAVLTAGGGFEEAVGAGVREVLSSPRFLYRFEAAADPALGYRALDSYELASRLSYFLWSSMPDAELFGLADQATLTEGPVLQAQVSRLLGHQNAQALTDNFAGQWLFHRAIPGITKNPTWHPDYDAALNADLLQEAKSFFAFIAQGGGSAADLVTGDYGFLNDRLRKYYGLPVTGGTGFERTSLATTGRRGLLGQAGLLSYLAGPERSSPVSRGKWILNQLLCSEAAPPPKGVPPLPALTDTESMTMREVMVQHRASPACAGCHTLMDPMGFALENFDGAGKWIDDYRGKPLDLTGQMPTTGVAFNGPTELAAAIAGDSRFARCVTSKLFTYATARAPDAFDDKQIDLLTQDFTAASFSFPALVTKLVTNPAFTLRRANQ